MSFTIIVIAVVVLFCYKYIFGGKEGVNHQIEETRRKIKARSRRQTDMEWKRKFMANMADIEEHWAKDFPRHKRQNVVVKGALKRFEAACTEQEYAKDNK